MSLAPLNADRTGSPRRRKTVNEEPVELSFADKPEIACFDWAAIGRMIRAQTLQAFGLHVAATNEDEPMTPTAHSSDGAEHGEAA